MAQRITGEEIRAWRKARGLTMKRLAELLDESLSNIKNWEYGTNKPPGCMRRALEGLKHLKPKPPKAKRRRKAAADPFAL